jgi:hypothetical protein
MYSGSTLTNLSGNLLGAHQKIDRASRHALNYMLKDKHSFPTTKKILHFEGKNGPDGIKRKSPAKDEPWHFYDPFDPEDGHLLEIIDQHQQDLIKALKQNNLEKSAFEAAWLAHAIVDGLTPAHHYPYDAELEKLRGETKESRDSIKAKLLIPGATKRELILKNWEMWGAKGLFTTHALFEMGAAMIFAPLGYHIASPTRYDIKTVNHLGFTEYFKRVAREVAMLQMYEDFYKRGWTRKIARLARKELAPKMASTVTLAWYMSAKEAGMASAEV